VVPRLLGSHRGHGYLSLVSGVYTQRCKAIGIDKIEDKKSGVYCCRVQASWMGRSLVEGSPTVCVCVCARVWCDHLQ
jgi:hypothetical protein